MNEAYWRGFIKAANECGMPPATLRQYIKVAQASMVPGAGSMNPPMQPNFPQPPQGGMTQMQPPSGPPLAQVNGQQQQGGLPLPMQPGPLPKVPGVALPNFLMNQQG